MKKIKKIVKEFIPSDLLFVLDLMITRKAKSIKPENRPQALKRWYYKTTGEHLDLNNPRTYNEKIQWLKIYDNTAIKTRLSDKYLVKEWIKDKIGEEYIIPLLGVWKSADDIDFSKLPDKFVLKANHGSAFNIIVTDKSKINKAKIRKRLNQWLKLDYAFKQGFELHYSAIERRIIAEEYIEGLKGDNLEYKFFCFHGKPEYCYILKNSGKHGDIERYTFDMDWNLQPWRVINETVSDFKMPKPEFFDLMLALTKELCKEFAHVRVDWYDAHGKLYLGEMTFTSGAGRDKIYPKEYSNVLDNLLDLSKCKGAYQNQIKKL